MGKIMHKITVINDEGEEEIWEVDLEVLQLLSHIWDNSDGDNQFDSSGWEYFSEILAFFETKDKATKLANSSRPTPDFDFNEY